MVTHRLILPGDLNQFGFLFGGRMLAWVDEASWIAASLDFPKCRFVTVAMDRVEFHEPVAEGAILEIESTRQKMGETSICYQVTVREGEREVFATSVTFVNVTETGEKAVIA